MTHWTEATKSLCPVCLISIPATIREEQQQIWMTSACPRHGEHRALLASDATEYHRLRQYVPDRVGGCCGPGETCGTTEGPPTCVLLLEITLACNLRCPTCYADAHGHDFMSLDEAKGRLDSFFAQQSRLDVLMISGGEPTIHPQFEAMLDLALSYPIDRILINTNGLRLQQSQAMVDILARRKERIELFFSFSSFRAETHERLYGRDLRNEKLFALEKAREAGLFVTLVATVERGVNEAEIGELFRYALSMDNIAGLNFQPVMSSGRYEHAYDPTERLTLTDTLRLLEDQTDGQLLSTDFVGLPCSHPDCCAITYCFLDEKREKVTPLPRHLDIARYMEMFSDRISFAGMIGAAARRIWSDVSHLRAKQTLSDLATLFKQANIRTALPLIGDQGAFGRRIFRVVVKPFMDAHTYDEKRIEQCCTKILTEDGEAISFCQYNVLHRSRAAARENAIPLTLVR